MGRCFFIIVFFYYSLTFSQPLTNFSKTFEAAQKNIPLNIISNNHSVFILRYNKSIHDFIFEKRVKATGQMLVFKPLKLDSVCADWFDYENLDYLFFEADNKLYLVFEKDMKTKKTIYLKTIDTSGKVGGFKELAAMEWNNTMAANYFKFKRAANNNLLILGTINYLSGIVQKTALLFDVKKETPVWIKKLPDENFAAAATNLFETNTDNDLFFTRYNVTRITDTAGKVFVYDTLALCKINANAKKMESRPLALPENYGLHDAFILSVNNEVVFFACACENMATKKGQFCNGYFVCQKFSNDLSTLSYSVVVPYDESTQHKLTYFDGTDYKDPGLKPFAFSDHFTAGNNLITIMETYDRGFYKNIFAVNFDLEKGQMKWMHVVPRKIFFFPKRIVYRNIGCYNASYINNTLNICFLENSMNLNLDIKTTPYNQYEKQINYWGCNAVRIKINDSGEIKKELFYRDRSFDLVPLKNTPLQPGVPATFYITNGRGEKFGFE